jgi:hypothetical protein
MFVRMIDVFCGVYPAPPDESGGYRMIDVFGVHCLNQDLLDFRIFRIFLVYIV